MSKSADADFLEVAMFWQQILNGLTNGFIYALIAIGFSMVYSTMRLINFAQGSLFMVGSFIGLMLSIHLSLPFPLLFLLTVIVTFILGVVLEKLTLSFIRGKAAAFNMMVSTIGLMVLLKDSALVIWGSGERRFPSVVPALPLQFSNIIVPPYLFLVGGFSIGLMLILTIFLKYTRLGLSMRAAAHDPLMAELMGVSTRSIYSLAFGISAALGGAAGVLIAPLWFVYFGMGSLIGLKGFTAAVLGSLGSIPGAIFGGLFLGIVENLTAGYISSTWKDAISFGILIAALVFRPEGLLGKRSIRKV